MQVKYTPEFVSRFWAKVDSSQGSDSCWKWKGGIHHSGYGVVSWHRRMKNAHRVAWELTHGPIPDGMYACHHCDNRSCVNPSHLFLGTNTDNLRDMCKKGRHADVSGEKNGAAKLDRAKVARIRELHDAGGITHEVLARDFGISLPQIYRIVHFKHWR